MSSADFCAECSAIEGRIDIHEVRCATCGRWWHGSIAPMSLGLGCSHWKGVLFPIVERPDGTKAGECPKCGAYNPIVMLRGRFPKRKPAKSSKRALAIAALEAGLHALNGR